MHKSLMIKCRNNYQSEIRTQANVVGRLLCWVFTNHIIMILCKKYTVWLLTLNRCPVPNASSKCINGSNDRSSYRRILCKG